MPEQKKSIFQDKIYAAMAWCKDTGIFDKMLRDVLLESEVGHPLTGGADNVVLSLEHLLASFLILGVGLTISGISFCFEKRSLARQNDK